MDLSPAKLNKALQASLYYHSLFDYPMKESELARWTVGKKVKFKKNLIIQKQNDWYFLSGHKKNILKRLQNESASTKKLEIAKLASRILTHIPTILMIGVTGSLAMNNANEKSDIDLILVTKNGTLWLSRILAFLLLNINGVKIRRAGEKEEKDRFCLNLWIDENDLVIENKNIYTAHELAQIKPLINKNKTYEKLIYINNWIKDYWPKAVERKYKVLSIKYKEEQKLLYTIYKILNILFFYVQYQYMKGKITREQVSKTRAFFHPYDWGDKITKKF